MVFKLNKGLLICFFLWAETDGENDADVALVDRINKEIDENGLKHYYCIKDHKENYIYPLKKIADLFKKKNLKLAFNAHQENDFSHQQYTLDQLKENIQAFEIELPSEVLKGIEAIHTQQPNPAP